MKRYASHLQLDLSVYLLPDVTSTWYWSNGDKDVAEKNPENPSNVKAAKFLSKG
ncbi:unnamed protein product [Arabidopsis thaliana]|uniref:Uncharacterized protein n=1 Tax=Arabidopsis thaliana TaxID=3702 RepID=A0A654EL02_ARATH|nr:unnamed protein product [Arabidopsis thaliana]